MCITPLIITQKEYARTVPVPCGRCPECYSRRASAWSFRLMQQEKVSDNALFITLTYDTQHVPLTRNGYMSLRKRDLQLFFKRLRKAQDKRKATDSRYEKMQAIRYYVVGEYGGRTKRPHYHALIYNVIPELIQDAWLCTKDRYDKKENCKCGKHLGNIHYGTVSGASVGYTLKYMSKCSQIPMHQNDDRIPEFALMSKGLGANYLTPQMIKWHRADLLNRMYVNLPDNKKVSMPRYYKTKIYDEIELMCINDYQAHKREKEGKETMSYRDKAEAHKAAFMKMRKNYLKNQKI